MTPMLDPIALEVAEEREIESPAPDPYDFAELCPWCAEPNLPRGGMGRLLHYSCRYCGGWYAVPNPELDA